MKPDFKHISLPDGGSCITIRGDRWDVPSNPYVAFIEGDGIGKTQDGILGVTECAIATIDAAIEAVYGNNRKIRWVEAYAGESARERYAPDINDEAFAALTPAQQQAIILPEETLKAIEYTKVALKGPLGTPPGSGFRSINVTLRKKFDLYACIRPIRYMPGAPSPNIHARDVNMIVFRENTEDVYAGIEFRAGTPEQRTLQELLISEFHVDLDLKKEYGIGIKPISKEASQRLVRRAIEYAIEKRYRTVTLVHKGNIQKHTEGAFLNWGYELAATEFADKIVREDQFNEKDPVGGIVINDHIADAMFQYAQQKPSSFSVLVMSNLNGDYFSDMLATLVGGLGVSPGANIGDEYAIFEAIHGTAPAIAGKDLANPSSVMLSGAMMLDYFGWTEAAALVRKAIANLVWEAHQRAKPLADMYRIFENAERKVPDAVVRALKVTPLMVTGDLAEQYRGYAVHDGIKCSEFTHRVLERITDRKRTVDVESGMILGEEVFSGSTK